MRPSVLIAGIGDAMGADDGFGVEVARQLTEIDLPRWVRVADYGTSGMRLAFDLLDRYETTILIDALPRGEPSGTLSVLEVQARDRIVEPDSGAFVDAHEMRADTALELLDLLGGDAGRVLVVGCEPRWTVRSAGLSEPVRRAVPEAVRRIEALVHEEDRRLVQHAISLEV